MADSLRVQPLTRTSSGSLRFQGAGSVRAATSLRARTPSTTITGDFDLSTPAGLLELAASQGGAVSAIAEELTNPSKTIWSSVTAGFKKSFRAFIDVISVPSELVTAAISPKIGVREAIEKDIFPSEVIFGDPDPDDNTFQKIGSFSYRLAVDILLDPLTYLTFGAGVGLFGVRATSKVPVVVKSGEKVFRRLSKAGQQAYREGVDKQIKGLTATAKKGAARKGLAGEELDLFVKSTISAELDREFVKTSLGKLVANDPNLARTWLDKGGIKFFGQSVLSGQRINSAIKAVPGFTFVDNLTAPLRNSVMALWNPKWDATFGKLPEELIRIEQVSRDLFQARKIKSAKGLTDIVRANKLNVNEANFLMTAVEPGKIPADKRLARAYLQAKAFSKAELKQLRAAGFAVEELKNHAPHVLVDQPVKGIPFKMPPSQKTGAMFQRKIEGTVAEIAEAGFEGFDPNIITATLRRSLEN